MKKVLSLAVLSAVMVGSAWGARACPAVQKRVMVPVQFTYTYKTDPKRKRIEIKNYPQWKLEWFATLKYLFEDSESEQKQLCSAMEDGYNMTECLPFENNTFLVPVHGVSPLEFDCLLDAANPAATQEDRQLTGYFTEFKNIDVLLKLYKLATFLDPVDKKTSYPMVLALLRHINRFSQAGTADNNPRINFLIEGLQEHNFSQTNVGLMVGDFLQLFVDGAPIFARNTEVIEIASAFAVVRDTEYLKNSVTNNQVEKFIHGIKQKAVAASNKPTLIHRVTEYLARFGATPETFLVPGTGPDKPTVGRFPLSIKDLQNAQLMLEIFKNGLYLGSQGLTNLDGLDTIDGIGNVRSLSVKSNNLGELQPGVFACLDQLQELYLDNNQLRELQTGVFAGLGNLQKLSLHNNQLSGLPVGIFAGLSKLQELNLVLNQLTITVAQLRKQNPDLRPGCTISLKSQKSAQ